MRRLYTFLLIVFACITASAERITEQQALQKAQQFFCSRGIKGQLIAAEKQFTKARTRSYKDIDYYYVFNVGFDKGYVIISADDRTPVVLGYADEGAFDVDKIPSNMAMWLDGFAEQIKFIQDNNISCNTSKSSDNPPHEAIDDLIKTKWGQAYPYNILCPTIDDENCLTGCAATAMAQIMYYHRFPNGNTEVIPEYTTSKNNIQCENLSETTFDWDDMQLSYDDSSSQKAKEAVAKLMKYSGNSIKADYSLDETTAYLSDVMSSFYKYFGYSSNSIKVQYRDSTISDYEWENLIYYEISNGRPVLYQGSGDHNSAHGFIVHGYDGNGMFKINWGWDGRHDGYFLLNILTPSEDFSKKQMALIGISPTDVDTYQINYDTEPDSTKVATGDLWGPFAEDSFWDYYQSVELWDPNNIYPYFLPSDTIEIATFIPGEETLIGAQVTAIRIPVHPLSIEQFRKGTAWLADSLDESTKVRSVSLGGINQREWNELVLSEPYTITEKGLYVGMKFPKTYFYCLEQSPADSLPTSYVNGNGAWRNSYPYEIPLQIRVMNHHLPQSSASVLYFIDKITYPNKKTNQEVVLLNHGTETIKSIDYTITIDGNSESHHLDIKPMPSGSKSYKQIFMDVVGPSQVDKYYSFNVTIDKVNGKTNDKKDIVYSYEFKNLSRPIDHRVIMMEYTGTWCGWCPRGMAAMKIAQERYGNKFIGICNHKNDPMDINCLWFQSTSFPSCDISGICFEEDPYYIVEGYGYDAIGSMINTPRDIDIKVKGVWNSERNEVLVTGDAEIFTDNTECNMGFFLIADSLKGTTKDWYQYNYYSHNSNFASDPNLSQYVDSDYYLTDIVYNNVLIGYSSFDYYGYDYHTRWINDVKAGDKWTETCHIKIPVEGELADAIDKDNVYVVAVVYNENGYTNAAIAKVIFEDSDDIKIVPNENKPFDVFSLSGVLLRKDTRSLKGLSKGIYIVNGRKVAVGDNFVK